MCGLAPYWKNKTSLDLHLLERNQYVCKILKKKYPNAKIINKPGQSLKADDLHFDTIFMSAGCLIYFSDDETNNFFKATKFIKNFVFINEATFKDDLFGKYSGHRYVDCRAKLKKYNVNYNNSKIYIGNETNRNILDYLIFTSA